MFLIVLIENCQTLIRKCCGKTWLRILLFKYRHTNFFIIIYLIFWSFFNLSWYWVVTAWASTDYLSSRILSIIYITFCIHLICFSIIMLKKIIWCETNLIISWLRISYEFNVKLFICIMLLFHFIIIIIYKYS